MADRTNAGPSGLAAWKKTRAGAFDRSPLSVLLLPDESENAHYALLDPPVLWRKTPREPAFSLTLLLERQPLPEEENIAPLILSGSLALEVSLAASHELLAQLSETVGAEVRPLFARSAIWTLTASDDPGAPARVLAIAQSSGTSIRAALNASLQRDEALDVIAALDGVRSTMKLSADLTFRVAARASTLRISASWTAVYESLLARADPQRTIALADVRAAFADMLARGTITACRISDSGVEEPIVPGHEAALFNGFLRTMPVVASRMDDDRFRLKEKPHPAMTLEYSEASPVDTLRSIRIEGPLDQLLNGALEGLDRSAFIHVICPQTDGGGIGPVPRKVRFMAPTRTDPSQRSKLSALDGDIKSVSLAMRPSSTIGSASVLANSNLVLQQRPQVTGSGRLTSHLWLDDLILENETGQLRKLPVVADPAAPLWPDRVEQRVYWYAPVFSVLSPLPNSDADSAPFGFTYQGIGVTADGKPAINATVRITLKKQMSQATAKALQLLTGARAKPVAIGGLSVTLSIPYINSKDGKMNRSFLQAGVAENGDTVQCTIQLLNETARLAYGALAIPGFQPEGAQIVVAFTYQAYVPMDEKMLNVIAGGKIALTPIANTRKESLALSRQPHLDASEASFRFGKGEVRFEREAALAGSTALPSARAVMALGASGALMAHPTLHPGTATTVAGAVALPTTHSTVAIARPPVTPSPTLDVVARKSRYAMRTLVRQDRLDLSFPCETLGSFYREQTGEGIRSVGCVDALRLGQATISQYSEMTALATPQYRVFRSLQQPGRFLILPAAYRITRYERSVPGKAYRPAIAVYSYIDVDEAANNRVIYHATLQPDIPLHSRRVLWSQLSLAASHPVVEYPTEVGGDFEYSWTIGAAVRIDPAVVKGPDSFQVTLATDLGGALLLRTMVQTSGIFGSARLKLPDGTSLDMTLAVDLNEIVGPWSSGPLEVTLEPEQVHIVNRIERPVEISDLMVYRGGNTAEKVHVEKTLAAGESWSAGRSGAVEAHPVYSLPAGTPAVLEEMRSFVEDILTNVVFIDLLHYENHGLRKLDLEVQIKGVPGTRAVAMQGDPPRGAVDFLLPLTTYLAKHVLQFRVTKTFVSAPSQATGWFEWDLESNGNIVSLTWELIQ